VCYSETRVVSFQVLNVTVTHWQSLVQKKVPIQDSTTFLNFCRLLRTTFSEEITTKSFRVYKLPYKVLNIEDKVWIASETVFLECVAHLKQINEFHPEIYICIYEDESQKKLPAERFINENQYCGVVSHTSRDSATSKLVKN